MQQPIKRIKQHSSARNGWSNHLSNNLSNCLIRHLSIHALVCKMEMGDNNNDINFICYFYRGNESVTKATHRLIPSITFAHEEKEFQIVIFKKCVYR